MKKDSCFINQRSLRTFQKKSIKGALDGQKEPRVDRSFFVNYGKHKVAVFVTWQKIAKQFKNGTLSIRYKNKYLFFTLGFWSCAVGCPFIPSTLFEHFF